MDFSQSKTFFQENQLIIFGCITICIVLCICSSVLSSAILLYSITKKDDDGISSTSL